MIEKCQKNVIWIKFLKIIYEQNMNMSAHNGAAKLLIDRKKRECYTEIPEK